MRYLLILFSFIIFTACENSTIAPNDELLGLQFFPIKFSESPLFEVEEINYRNDGSVDTLNYFLQDEWIDSTFQQNSYQLVGYRHRIELNDQKSIFGNIVRKRSRFLANEKIGNVEEVKLSFPVKEAKSWNGFPQQEEADDYILFKVFQPYTLADSTFESSLQVIQSDNQDSISNYDQRIEVYVADVGLIYKISSQLEFCRETECLGLQQIDFGKTVRMKRVFE